MMRGAMKFVSFVFIGGIATVAAAPYNSFLYPRAACSGNSASDRTVWCDYDISTDYTTEVPDTGVTREYYFELTEVTVAPDGYSRSALTVNGSIPGPTIEADWGDTVVVHVTNSLTSSQNGTSIHFHGIRQNFTNQQDGVSSITQCPTAPRDSITYTWRASQYGSTWYHSHFALQAWEGVFGGIIINGPATANYDEDKGVLFLTDWSHQTVDELYTSAQVSGPPTLDNGLINGTNVYGEDSSSNQTGTRFNTSFTAGTSYRLRLVNGAIDTHFKFSIDNHTLMVIANDLVPIVPYNTTVLNIGIGKLEFDALCRS
jgi:FtsP/CotA-like multicopper oxidase with cupredoxin domain